MVHNTTHSVMFHHFHDHTHKPTQGSLSTQNFIDLLNWLKKNYSLIGAEEYISRAKNSSLQNSDVCLSFDDALKCQYDIALPILKDFNIDAFFFVYSSAFTDSPDYLEIFRLFRNTIYENLNDFYAEFFKIVEAEDSKLFAEHHHKYQSMKYLSAFPFYNESDKWFRYLRDQYLGDVKYSKIMIDLMNKKNFDIEKAKRNLWINEKELRKIDSQGHVIGLHSYSHPTQMSKLTKLEQKLEYEKNYSHLSRVLGKRISTMSHPCGDYNKNTLDVLSSLNIGIGFRSNMAIKKIISPLEIPREDHSNVFKEIVK